MSVCYKKNYDFPGRESFFAWIRFRIKVRSESGSGSVMNFFKPWIRIRLKMIRIRNIVQHYFSPHKTSSLHPFPLTTVVPTLLLTS